jgi:hypothetical protein
MNPSIKEGIGDAMGFWLSQHDVSVPDLFKLAIKEAVSEWLDRHSDEPMAVISKEVRA